MITELEISNFKSIKHLKQPCKRVNIFIGEPNTGKSNILEALGLLSYSQFGGIGGQSPQLGEFVRYSRTADLFYDYFIDAPLMVTLGSLVLNLEFQNGIFSGYSYNPAPDKPVVKLDGDHTELRMRSQGQDYRKSPLVKFYRFATLDKFPRRESEYLLPPNGENLVSLLLTNRELQSLVRDIVGRYGLKLALKPQDNAIEIAKLTENVLISYPYLLFSDTMQRVIFYLAAVLTNRDSVLVFEEPESHSFPYYTKYLAEIMALDERNNQYFIATHNPYFLEPIIEKTAKDDIAVFVTYFEDFQTKVRPLSQSEMEDVMQTDIFLNLERYQKAS